jgi:hypothetical protein
MINELYRKSAKPKTQELGTRGASFKKHDIVKDASHGKAKLGVRACDRSTHEKPPVAILAALRSQREQAEIDSGGYPRSRSVRSWVDFPIGTIAARGI